MVPKALLFDTFGTLVDWRGSLIAQFGAWGGAGDWAGLADAWRGEYAPSMDRVRRGEEGWAPLDALHRASLARLAPRFGLSLDGAGLDRLTQFWYRLDPWSDSAPGLARLHARFITAPLSNGNVALLADLARHGGLAFDTLFGADVFQHYKPDAETYLGACRLLGLAPGEVLMCAAHNADLAAARALGLGTAFIARPAEHGPNPNKDARATGDWDYAVASVEELAAALGC